jgi:hypothetical protein
MLGPSTVTCLHRLGAPLASVLALVLALGLWLQGPRSADRERLVRRSARSGWSSRALGSAVWVVPDQELGATTPCAGGGGDDAAPGHVEPPGCAPVTGSITLLAPASPPFLGRTASGSLRGRAPPVCFS